MRRAVLLLIAACGAPSDLPPPKRPNNELVVGDFARKPPDGEMAVRFGNGTYFFTKSKAELEKPPHLADGTFTLDGDTLTFTADKGMCADAAKSGSYKVVISKIGIRFTKVDDDCADRARLDGQTLWRLK